MKKIRTTLLLALLLCNAIPAHAFKYEHYDNAPDYCIEEFKEVFKTIKAEDDAIYEKIQFEEDTRMFMDDYLDKRVTAETNARKKADTILQQNIDNEVNARIEEDNLIKADLKNNWDDHKKYDGFADQIQNNTTNITKNAQNIEKNTELIQRGYDYTKNVYNTLDTKIDNNVSNLQNEDKYIHNRINNLKTNVDNNTQRIDQHETIINNHEERITNNTQNIQKVDQKVDYNHNMTQKQINNLSNRMDQNYNQVNQRINKLDDKIEGGLATVSALTALHPNPRCNTRTQIAVGAGMYADNVAGAVGLFHWINDRVMLNAGASYGGSSQWAGNVGMSIGIGRMK